MVNTYNKREKRKREHWIICNRSSNTTGKGPRNYKCTYDPETDTQGLRKSNQAVFEYETEKVKSLQDIFFVIIKRVDYWP